MGLYLSVHIGPYIEVKKTITRDSSETIRICPNHPNNVEIYSSYCPTCGTKIETVIKPITKTVSAWDTIFEDDDFVDNLHAMPYNGNILLPNKYAPQNIKFDNDGDNCIDLTDIKSIQQIQMDWMNSQFKKEISYLEKIFGKENINIKWGIISYYS